MAEQEKTQTPAVTANFEIEGSIRLRGDGAAQSAFNLLVKKSPDAMQKLKALADVVNNKPENQDKTPIRVTNEAGEAYITVKMDPKSVIAVKRLKAFEVNVEGLIRITGASNGQFRGELSVKNASLVDILNGGRVVDRPVMDDEMTAAPTGTTSLRGFRK